MIGPIQAIALAVVVIAIVWAMFLTADTMLKNRHERKLKEMDLDYERESQYLDD